MKLGCITCRREARWLGKVDLSSTGVPEGQREEEWKAETCIYAPEDGVKGEKFEVCLQTV